jgi:signal transduction histidine kinase
LSTPPARGDSPWEHLERDFLDAHPLMDSLSVPMLARTTMIGVLSMARFGFDAPVFSEHERRFADDLSARIALAIDNARLYDNARAAIEVRDTFLTIAAHELKTPLTTIQGYAQLLSHQLEQGLAQDPAPVRRSARMIEDRTRHVARLVEQILDVSILVASRMHLERTDTDLVAMIRKLVADLEKRGGPHDLRLHVPREHLLAAVDGMRVQQVMTNLIDNAVRFSPEGGPIDLTVVWEAESVVLSVRDRGLGVPEEHRPQLFDRFHQAHARASRSGIGLGLYISREIVVLHGGDITASFPADGGSEFIVRLPLADPLPA